MPKYRHSIFYNHLSAVVIKPCGPVEYVTDQEGPTLCLSSQAINFILTFLDDFDQAHNLSTNKIINDHTRHSKLCHKSSIMSKEQLLLGAQVEAFKNVLASYLFRKNSDYSDLYSVMYLLICDIYIAPANRSQFYDKQHWLHKVQPNLLRLSNLEISLFSDFISLLQTRLAPAVSLLYLLELGKILTQRPERAQTHDMYKDCAGAQKCYQAANQIYYTMFVQIYNKISHKSSLACTNDFAAFCEFVDQNIAYIEHTDAPALLTSFNSLRNNCNSYFVGAFAIGLASGLALVRYTA